MDYAKLKEAIAESGLKQTFIAKRIGLSDKAFHDRAVGVVRWKAPEIAAFCKVLRLNKKQRDSIFFT